jgi:ubiquitin-conjugating enzyme E2 D/E
MVSLAKRRMGAPDFSKEDFRKKLTALSSVKAVAAAPMTRGAVTNKCDQHSVDTIKRSVPLGIALGNPKLSCSNKRVLKELQDISRAALQNFRVYPTVDESGCMSGTASLVFLGQKDHAAYGGRAFLLRVNFPSDYPFQPPRLSFVTPIHHYAVATDGSLCLPVLRDTWSPSLSLKKVLEELDFLLHDPRHADPNCDLATRSWLSELLRTDPDRYFKDASEHSKHHAKEASRELDATSLLHLFN